MSPKNERADFCAQGLLIIPKAQPWASRIAGLPATLNTILDILSILSK
jgi:hypothetical protein